MPRKRKSSLSRVSSQAQAKRLARSLETPEDTALRRKNQAKRQAALRASETPAETQHRLLKQAARQTALRTAETPAKTQRRLLKQAQRQTALRAAETPTETQHRLFKQVQRQAALRDAEMPAETRQRLSAQADQQYALRASETFEQTQVRRYINAQLQAERRRYFQRNNCKPRKKSDLNNACSRKTRQIIYRIAEQSDEPIEERNTAQQIITAEIISQGFEKERRWRYILVPVREGTTRESILEDQRGDSETEVQTIPERLKLEFEIDGYEINAVKTRSSFDMSSTSCQNSSGDLIPPGTHSELKSEPDMADYQSPVKEEICNESITEDHR